MVAGSNPASTAMTFYELMTKYFEDVEEDEYNDSTLSCLYSMMCWCKDNIDLLEQVEFMVY